jgi:hypothetical protein
VGTGEHLPRWRPLHPSTGWLLGFLCRGRLKCSDLNSSKAEAKLVKALDYLVAINDDSDNPVQKWVINESIQSLAYRLLQAGDKEILRKPPLLYPSG